MDKHTVEGEDLPSSLQYADVDRNEVTRAISTVSLRLRAIEEITEVGRLRLETLSCTEDSRDLRRHWHRSADSADCWCSSGYQPVDCAAASPNAYGPFITSSSTRCSCESPLQVSADGLTRVGTAGDMLVGNLPIALPPLPEQTAIAAFLDRETAKIDALVAEQRRLIDLLREKRQAVISHAVTKGLNPNAPLKPSGIDWLGDVPEGWEVRKVSIVCERMTYGIHEPYADY